jgi:hypothetical protein
MKLHDMDDDVPNDLHREDNSCTRAMRFANCGSEDNILRCINRPTASCLECQEEYPYDTFQSLARQDDAQSLCMAYERRSHRAYTCSYEYLEQLEPCEPKFKFVRTSGYCTGNTVAGDFECAVGTQLISHAETTLVVHAQFQEVCCEVSTEHCSCGSDSAGEHERFFSVDVIQDHFVETHSVALLSIMLTVLGVLRILALYDLYQAEGCCPCGPSLDGIDDYSSIGRDKQFDEERAPFHGSEEVLSEQGPHAELLTDEEQESEMELAAKAAEAAAHPAHLHDHGAPAPDDEDMERRLQREKATCGEMSITLLWDSIDDLDLHCITPAGDEIHHNLPTSRHEGEGEMDVIMNMIEDDATDQPIEHIFFLNPPRGRYTVFVKKFTSRTGRQPTPFRVRLSLPGGAQDREQSYSDIAEMQSITVFNFDFPEICMGAR